MHLLCLPVRYDTVESCLTVRCRPTDYFVMKVLILHLDDVDILLRQPDLPQCLNTETLCQLRGPTDYFAVEVLIQHFDDVNTLLRKPVTSKDLPVSEYQSFLSVAVHRLLYTGSP